MIEENSRAERARELVAEFRAAVLELEPSTLTPREIVVAFAFATKLKNFVERRVDGLRKGANLLFTGEHALKPTERLTQHFERVFDGGRTPAPADVVAVKLANGTFGQTALSEAKALALLAKKKYSAARLVMETPPPAPPPVPRFSPAKFRELVAKEAITQAEYDACLEPLAPRPTMTVDVPHEIEEALVAMLLRAPEDD